MNEARVVLAPINSSIWPDLQTFPMLHVINPLALVSCPSTLDEHAMSMSLVVLPKTFITVSIHVLETAISLCLVGHPLPQVSVAFRPSLDTLAVATITQPFTSEDRTIRHGMPN